MKKIGPYVQWLLLIAMVLALGLCTQADFDVLWEKDFPLFVYLLLFYGLFVAAGYLSVIIHEAGHLLFGLLTGYRFSSFRIFGFVWMRNDNGRLCMKRYKLLGTAGQCLMEPPELVNGKMPTVLYNMGGAILNLAFSMLLSGVWFVLAKVCGYRGFVTMLVAVMTIYNVYSALANGVPLHAGMLDNDGMNALMLRKNPMAMRAFWIELKYMAMLAQGKGILDMPEEWSQLPTDAEMQNSHVEWLGGLKTDRLIAGHQFEEAIVLMDHLLSAEIALSGVTRCALTYERIFCECMCGRDRKMLDALRSRQQMKYMKAMKDHPGVIRTEYAYARLVELDAEKASGLKKRFERVSKNYAYSGFLEHDRELMRLVDENTMV